jgi:antimicrobial peptide system SdpA family protein
LERQFHQKNSSFGKADMKALLIKFARPNFQSSTNLGVLALIHLGWLTAIAITAAVAAMPFNTLNLSDDARNTVMSLIPEGWGFFTKSPRDPEMQVAVLRGGRLEKLNIVSSFQAKYAFGFDRLSRAQGFEIDGLLSQLKTSSLWHDCQQTVSVCAQNLLVQKQLVNSVQFPTLCGNLVLFERRPIPWAYRNSQPIMPSRLTRVEVVCSHV